jgi:hypothetical protein
MWFFVFFTAFIRKIQGNHEKTVKMVNETGKIAEKN